MKICALLGAGGSMFFAEVSFCINKMDLTRYFIAAYHHSFQILFK